MAASIREIIKEAVTRINLVPRRQAVPGDILENAYKLLKGVVAKYNVDNLLSFTQNQIEVPLYPVTHIYDEDDFYKGKNNLYFDNIESLNEYVLTSEDKENDVYAIVKNDLTKYYTVTEDLVDVFEFEEHPIEKPVPTRVQHMLAYCQAQHIQAKDVVKINSVYLKSNQAQLPVQIELRFVPNNKFDDYTNDARVFTTIEKSENEWILKIKPIVSAMYNYDMLINYNEGIEFDLDDTLYIPDNYTELLIVALAHKLALQYPRLDDAQMQRLQLEVQTLVDNVRTPKAITRHVVRSDYDYVSRDKLTQSELLAGSWF